MEVKTNTRGDATMDFIEAGSHVTVQVFASGFATFANEFDVTAADKSVLVKLVRPKGLISNYDTGSQSMQTEPGVQERAPNPQARATAFDARAVAFHVRATAFDARAVAFHARAGPGDHSPMSLPGSLDSSLDAAAEAKPLAGRRVLVTGGAKRIGRALALALAESGANVAITYRGSQFEAEQTVTDLLACGVNAFAVVCDVREEASVQAAVGEAVERLHGLDVLVNNAGAFETVALENISVAQWDAMFDTNTRGPFLVARAAHPALKAARGASSTSARSRPASLGHARALLHVEGRAAHAFAHHGQGLGAGDQRQLRRAGHDRYRQGRRRVRTLRPQDANAAQRRPRLSPPPCCSSPPDRTSSPGSCWPSMAAWGCKSVLPV